ncbi:MAG: alpha/beta fold hydrolase [Planctomycetaceae bacterium]|nr:alpha/beta fold hydrolase [Planctomycetaceae bacterium]
MIWPAIAITIALLGLAYLVAEAKIVRLVMSIFERPPTFLPPETEPDEEAERISFRTSDGVKISACLNCRDESISRGLIIFCPEYGANKWSWKKYCRGLWEAGFDVLALDFRNQGDSERVESYGELHWLTEYEIEDVKAAIQYVKSQPDLAERPIGLMGVSRGGAAALAAGADSPDVELIATDSAFPTEPLMMYFVDRWVKVYAPQWVYNLVPRWHTRFTLKMVKRFSQMSRHCQYAEILPRLKRMESRKRVMLVAGSGDSFVDLKVTNILENALGAKCEELWIVDNAKHNMSVLLAPDEYQVRLENFFSQMSPVHEQPVRMAEEATA